MEQGKIAKQMVDFHKSSFDSTFRTMSILQEQTGRMVGMVLEQSSWVPIEGKNAIQDCVKAYNKGLADFKASADDGFTKVEDYFAGFYKQAK